MPDAANRARAHWANIRTELPGSLVAQVTRTIYSPRGQVAIPVGTKVVGSYDSRVFNGQSRMLVAFREFIFPDGETLRLPGTEAGGVRGSAGVAAHVDNHLWSSLGSAFLVAELSNLANLGGGGGRGVPREPERMRIVGPACINPGERGMEIVRQRPGCAEGWAINEGGHARIVARPGQNATGTDGTGSGPIGGLGGPPTPALHRRGRVRQGRHHGKRRAPEASHPSLDLVHVPDAGLGTGNMDRGRHELVSLDAFTETVHADPMPGTRESHWGRIRDS